MFKRKLTALEFHAPDNFNINDEQEYRNMVVWLEDQKIRHYKIEDRMKLRTISANDWEEIHCTYLKDVGCPHKPSDRKAVMDWLLGIAVRAEYGDNVEKYKEKTAENVMKQSSAPQIIASNPLDNLNFDDPDFKNGVNRLAQLLNVAKHPDHLITLKAVSHLITERLSDEVIQNPQELVAEGKPFPLQESDLGFDTGDYVLNQAAKILRFLYIRDLRNLQTKINESIVSVQAITANPKTDTRLGKVGK